MRLRQHHAMYLGLAALTVVSLFILWLGYLGHCPLREQASRIHVGMSESEVRNLLGPCKQEFPLFRGKGKFGVEGGPLKDAARMLIWHNERTYCTIIMDDRSKVSLVNVSDARPPLLERLRAYLRQLW